MRWSKDARQMRRLPRWFVQMWQRGARALRPSLARRDDLRMLVTVLGLIILPSGLLGYFSWRAIENERLLSRQRLQESYGQFARLTAREIDSELRSVASGWVTAVEEMFAPKVHHPAVSDLDRLTQQETLIAASFLLTGPGKVAYPPTLSMPQEGIAVRAWEEGSYLDEHTTFESLVAQGEELEYRSYDLAGALAIYRDIRDRVTHPQLRGLTESYIGRVLMKTGDWETALATFQGLMTHYPEARDLNKMYLRFLAQYQIAVCLENMGRDHDAIQVLLQLNQDLLDRSDTINTVQYSYFVDQIRYLAPRLLTSPHVHDAEVYQAQFQQLAQQSKKHISQKYFLELLDRRLTQLVIERKTYRSKFYYVSDEADDEPYLLAYRALSGPNGLYTSGLLGIQVDLAQLSQRLFPALLRRLKSSENVALAILHERGKDIIGTSSVTREPIAVQRLASPFDFWQVAVYVRPEQAGATSWDFYSVLRLWVISLLLLSIVCGVHIFMRRARREAHLSRLKTTFVSNVSHELRTPLASIKLLAELLEMRLTGVDASAREPLRGREGEYLRVIRRECDRLGRLIENVLDFSKIERGVKQYTFEYEDPAIVIQQAIETFRPHAEAQGFTLEVDLADTLPEVRMDADAMSQAMLNLLSNAVKYSDVVKDICVRVYRATSTIVIEVTDRGIGIDAAEMPKIFQNFYRVDQRLNAQAQGGMGLGLTLVQHIVRAHGGDITVQSEVDKGSTFRLTLPIPADELPSVDVAASTLERASVTRQG